MLRTHSYGEHSSSSLLDKLGFALNRRNFINKVGPVDGKVMGDFGCGHNARISSPYIDKLSELTLIDISINDDLKKTKNVIVIEGLLPEQMKKLSDNHFDIILENNILEHLKEETIFLTETFRVLKSGGILMINVPSWRGKYFLELAAFKLGMSSEVEMMDHKNYYDPRDLWPKLIMAGFNPKFVKIKKIKFGLNTLAICKK